MVRMGHPEIVNFEQTLGRDQGASHANMGNMMGEHLRQREKKNKKNRTVQQPELGVSLVFRRNWQGSLMEGESSETWEKWGGKKDLEEIFIPLEGHFYYLCCEAQF